MCLYRVYGRNYNMIMLHPYVDRWLDDRYWNLEGYEEGRLLLSVPLTSSAPTPDEEYAILPKRDSPN